MTIRKVILQPVKVSGDSSYPNTNEQNALVDDDTYCAIGSGSSGYPYYNPRYGGLAVYFPVFNLIKTRNVISSKAYIRYSKLDAAVPIITAVEYNFDATVNLKSSISISGTEDKRIIYYVWVEIEYEEPYGDISPEELEKLPRTTQDIYFITSSNISSFTASYYSSYSKMSVGNLINIAQENNISIDDVYSITCNLKNKSNTYYDSYYTRFSICVGVMSEGKFVSYGATGLSPSTSKELSSSFSVSKFGELYYNAYYQSGGSSATQNITEGYYTITTMSPPSKSTSKLNIGENNISKAYLGNTEVIKAYLGDAEVFSK